ncbi:MAG: hypothetical protein SGJ01_09930 [Gemmatimonadota bacterium]|nr:hypothetical protein [Gemmatimonadota bacterium]
MNPKPGGLSRGPDPHDPLLHRHVDKGGEAAEGRGDPGSAEWTDGRDDAGGVDRRHQGIAGGETGDRAADRAPVGIDHRRGQREGQPLRDDGDVWRDHDVGRNPRALVTSAGDEQGGEQQR